MMLHHHRYISSTVSFRLSILTDYYIRKLIHRYKGRLKTIVVVGASIQADTHTSIDDVLESLYLEPEELGNQVKELELMTRYHQQLEQNSVHDRIRLQELEQQIFWIIGFKVLETSANNVLEMVSVKPNPRMSVAA
jgi:hypothetical protein